MSIIVTGDDFGLSEAVNEGIERAHRDGILSHASLMVTGGAVQDAVRRARRLPGLRVGLHLVVVEGATALPEAEVAALVDARGWFPSDQVDLGVRYTFSPTARWQLFREIRAQFDAFAATGLRLDHADAHKHMHLHPTVGRMLLEAGAAHDLRRVRVPAEPPGVMRALGVRPTLASRAMYHWCALLRRQVRAAGMSTTGAVYGLAWTGGMTEERVLRLLDRLPPGLAEIYFHPAARRDELLDALMPEYDHVGELAALVSPRVRTALAAAAARASVPA